MHPHNATLRYTPTSSHEDTHLQFHTEIHTYNFNYTACTFQCYTEIHSHNFTRRYTPTISITPHAPSQCHTEIHTYNFDYTACTLTMSHWDTHLQFRLHHMHPHNVTLRYTPTISHRVTHLQFRLHRMHTHNVTLRYTPTISITPHAPSQCHTEIHTYNFTQRYTPTISITPHAPYTEIKPREHFASSKIIGDLTFGKNLSCRVDIECHNVVTILNIGKSLGYVQY